MSSRGRMRHPVLAGLLGVLVLLIVAVGVLVATFDPRPRIEAAVTSSTGRQIAINGPVRLGLFPPSVTLHDVTLANPPGFSQKQMATVRTITLRVDLGALLHRDIVVRQLILDRPAITLERNKTGAANWEFARAPRPQAPAKSPASVTPRPMSLAVLDAQLHGGVIRYRDDRGGQSVTVDVPRLALTGAGADAPVHLAGEAVINGTAVTLAADAPALTKPFPLRLAVQAGAARASATVTETAKAISLTDLRIATPGGDLAGTADLAFAARPTLHAALTGTRIDLSALPHPVTPSAPPAAPPPPPAPAAPSTAKPPAATSPPTLPVSALTNFDADIRLTLQELAGGGQSLHGVALHAKVAGGALSVVGHASYAGSPVDLTAVADARPATPTLAVALNAPALPAATILAALGKPGFISGNVAVAANLHGAGDTQHALTASLNGFAAATMTGGRINARVLERSLGPAIARANPLAALGGAESDINCLAVRANVTHGVATMAPLLLSSGLATIDGGGTVDLAGATLDLHLQPQGRAGGIGFSVPMTMRGPWSDPRVAVSDTGVAAAGVRAALALLSGKGTGATQPSAPACAEALAAARR